MTHGLGMWPGLCASTRGDRTAARANTTPTPSFRGSEPNRDPRARQWLFRFVHFFFGESLLFVWVSVKILTCY